MLFHMTPSMIRHMIKLAREIPTPMYVMKSSNSFMPGGMEGDIRIEKDVVWLHSQVTVLFTYDVSSHPNESHAPSPSKSSKFQKTH